jgi:hypothetical protein
MKLSILYKLAGKIEVVPETDHTVSDGRVPDYQAENIKKRGRPVNVSADVKSVNMGPPSKIDMANVEGIAYPDMNNLGGPIESAW